MYCIRKQLISSTVFRVFFRAWSCSLALILTTDYSLVSHLISGIFFFFFLLKRNRLVFFSLSSVTSFIHIFVVWFWSNLLPYSGGLCYVPFARTHFLPTFFNNWQKIFMNSNREKKNLKLEIYFHSMVFALWKGREGKKSNNARGVQFMNRL